MSNPKLITLLTRVTQSFSTLWKITSEGSLRFYKFSTLVSKRPPASAKMNPNRLNLLWGFYLNHFGGSLKSFTSRRHVKGLNSLRTITSDDSPKITYFDRGIHCGIKMRFYKNFRRSEGSLKTGPSKLINSF